MELNEKLYNEIVQLTEEADKFIEDDKYENGIENLKKALALLPEPKTEWDESIWIYGTLGDAYYYVDEFKNAKDSFINALNSEGGSDNPFILIRLGQVLVELGEEEKAKEYLLKAYKIEGEELFSEEDEKYFLLIKDKI